MPEAPPRAPAKPAPSGPPSVPGSTVLGPPVGAPGAPASRTLSEELAKRTPEILKRAREAQEEELTYQVGTLPGCPRWNIDLAGINFPRQTEDVVVVNPQETTRVPRVGGIVRMTPSKVEQVLDAIARRVVRFREGSPDGTVFDVTTGRTQYRPLSGDKPLADFVYMIRRADLDALAAPRPAYPAPLSAATTPAGTAPAP